MGFKNLKLKNKIVLMIAATSLIFTILCLFSLFLLRSMDNRHEKLMGDNGLAQGDIASIFEYISGEEIALRNAVNSTEADFKEVLKNRVSKLEADYDAMRTHFQVHIVDKEEEELIARVDELRKLRNTEFNRIMDLNSKTEMKKAIDTGYEKTADEFIAAWNNILNHKKAYADVEMKAMHEMVNRITIVVLVSIVIIVAGCVVVGIAIANSVAGRINQCVDRIKLLADGDLSSPAPDVVLKDESGELADATRKIVNELSHIITDIEYLTGSMAEGKLNVQSKAADSYVGDFAGIRGSIRKMRDSLTHILGEVQTASGQIKQGAAQVASGSQALSQGATQQASSIEELSSILTEISSHIKNDASSANAAAQQNTSVIEAVSQNNELMDRMSEAMQQISDRSSEISKIIKTINDIAFQTNILALNAAVEAARAGEAGKGFAVVADEVRNLAAKSAEAANNTEALIAESIAAVNNGVEIAQQTAESVNLIVDSTQKVDVLVRDIAKNTTTQSESISQINIGVDQISAVIQSNTATSEEQAASSQELAAQANYLEDLLSKFDLSALGNEYAAPVFHESKPEVKNDVKTEENLVSKPIERKAETKEVLKRNEGIIEPSKEELHDVKNSLEPMVYSPQSGVQTMSVSPKPKTVTPVYTQKMDDFGDIDPKY